ncbi:MULTISPECIES: TetR/AcrR family transcriptional regulator [Oceanobacillus]|uniref:TetR family transcriptional regulator n=1 Tax=Oceanobacillus kimchii TaxID=746691 RepID=A0ABQ5TMH6_9BACI|nr:MULTISPECIES: TetR/AcrR family transcriptional regulator [Oceanobacillus]MBT2600279.1 TetR family transcriptional regulator [Oceanobacillus sp. ISL-74]MBT2650437.1 TetR family transcriptional regulator [Oceanobacillus sp. ISL-73]MCT1578181.1 TetR/AcrR family transcriptional regulator [Oceanobacillus kimchii]MCT2134359.1 TetR/AcrR family transcriptional regulator [Oceanobacillus kimchii]OEH55014.1 transcriptional regulator [Oceanobacillus sp. E9]
MSLREQKTEKKKKEIIHSAMQIIAEKGYYRTTIEDIAAKLLITKGTVYYYFQDKQDLLFQSHQLLLKNSIENLKNIHDQPLHPREKLKKAMIAHMDHLLEDKYGFELMHKPEQFFSHQQLEIILQLHRNYTELLDQLIVIGIEEGVFQALDPKITRNIYLGAMNWLTQWYDNEGKKQKQDMLEQMAEYLLNIVVKQVRKGECL